MDVHREYLKAEQVAELLGMDVSGIYRMCREKTLPSIRIGAKAVRIPRAGLEAFLSKSAQGYALVEEALNEGVEDPLAALEQQAASFEERAGHSPREFVELWRSGTIPDSTQTADLAIEALSLRNALDRAGIRDALPA
jgi:excisionase family DNA binding protein